MIQLREGRLWCAVCSAMLSSCQRRLRSTSVACLSSCLQVPVVIVVTSLLLACVWNQVLRVKCGHIRLLATKHIEWKEAYIPRLRYRIWTRIRVTESLSHRAESIPSDSRAEGLGAASSLQVMVSSSVVLLPLPNLCVISPLPGLWSARGPPAASP